MKNFLNISEISQAELRNIIQEAKERKSKRFKLKKSEVDFDKPLDGQSMIMILKNLQQEREFHLILQQSNWVALQFF